MKTNYASPKVIISFLKRKLTSKSIAVKTSFFLTSLFISLLSPAQQSMWTSAGQNLSNTRDAATENKISVNNAGSLAKKWAFTTDGDVSATPAVDNKYLYFPDWAGNLYKVDANTGVQVWKKAFEKAGFSSFSENKFTPFMSIFNSCP